jgi:hypothetical protein
MTDRRDPYLILGIDHGTDAAHAAAAFARATRRVRTDAEPRYTIEDITWALHRIEQAETDPEASLDSFRVPADPTVYFDGQVDRLLPASSPLGPATSTRGTGRQLLEDRALLTELRHDLTEACSAMLDAPAIEPAPIDLSPEANQPTTRAPSTTGPTSKPPNTPSGASNGNSAVWWVIAAIIVTLFIGFSLVDQNGAGSSSSSENQTPSRPDRTTETAPTSPPPSSEPEPTETGRWVQRGDCLDLVRDDLWEPTSCFGHDAEIVSTHRGARSFGVCPNGSDGFFDDDWGVYCSITVSDDTPEGGHWGIGPIHSDTCVDVNRQGHLQGKTTCTASSIPVLTTATTPDGCNVPWAIDDFFVYWESVDGTSNVLCVDRFHWDAAGLPPPD